MGCITGDCGGAKSSAGKYSGGAAKKTPNWGMTLKPLSANRKSSTGHLSGFGVPKVKMSFKGKGY